MIVVADASPLNYLIQIDCDYLLPQVYGRIVVPSGVMRELAHPGAPQAVRQWLIRVPEWIEVSAIRSAPIPELTYLDPGEREAIQISEELSADLLLIDERQGRKEARRRGLRTTGTLGVLLSAGELRLIEPDVAYRRLLAETNFRTSSALEAEFRNRIRSAT